MSAFVIPPIAGAGQVVAYTGTAGTVSGLPGGAGAVWVFCTSVAHVKISTDASAATTADFPVPASVPVIIPVNTGGQRFSVSAIQSAAGGNLHVCPLGTPHY